MIDSKAHGTFFFLPSITNICFTRCSTMDMSQSSEQIDRPKETGVNYPVRCCLRLLVLSVFQGAIRS